jgi:hypothetical protein
MIHEVERARAALLAAQHVSQARVAAAERRLIDAVLALPLTEPVLERQDQVAAASADGPKVKPQVGSRVYWLVPVRPDGSQDTGMPIGPLLDAGIAIERARTDDYLAVGVPVETTAWTERPGRSA